MKNKKMLCVKMLNDIKCICLWMLLSAMCCGCWGCSDSGGESGEKPDNGDEGPASSRNLLFNSSDKKLESTFYWGKRTALSYAHDGNDPVGYWYEAALPGRNAFCMRDASHQSIAAEILGLSKHNFNIMEKFAENISEAKDWCTHWEIDKDNRPCKADYVSDDNFWYNLNANFDIIFACWRLYEWTGDERYLKNRKLAEFFDLSINTYVEHWQLRPDNIMSRKGVMHSNLSKRGIPSYVETFGGMASSSDLIATIYGGFDAYAKMRTVLGKGDGGEYQAQAEAYRRLLEEEWWNSDINAYHTFRRDNGTFADGEGLTYMLWFNAAQQTERIRGTITKMMERTSWNIENISHFPLLWYRYNYIEDAYEILKNISTMNRSSYPEVSYGMIEGIISGTMGIVPSASQKKVITLPKMLNPDANAYLQAENIPMLQGYITVRHDGNKATKFVNNTPGELIWQAAYMGEIAKITIDGEQRNTQVRTDLMGNKISYVEVKVPVGAEIQAKIE